MKIKTFRQANTYLEGFIPHNPKVSFRGEFGLKRAKYLLKLLGDPQNNLKVVHVAGTSGKGSTAYLTSLILRSLGLKVGLHVSPYLVDIRERVQINNRLIDKKKFIRFVNELVPIINKMRRSRFGEPTYFELTIALAFCAFYNEKVDYAVIETGLGGLYDASNTIERRDKLVILTKIGLDHTDILGKTIDKIAYQKAKIIKKENLVVSTKQFETAKKVIDQVAKQRRAKVYYLDQDFLINKIHLGKVTDFNYNWPLHRNIDRIRLGLLGDYQVENCSLALTATYLLSKRDKFVWKENNIRQALKQARFPGRLDIKKIKRKTVVFDGAHNPQKMTAFLSSLKQLYPRTKFTFLLAFKKGKDFNKMLSLIIPMAKMIYLTSFSLGNQDLPQLAVSPGVIGKALSRRGFGRFRVIPSPDEAFGKIINKEEGIFVVTGSFYLLSVVFSYFEISYK